MLKLYYSPNACSLASHIALAESGADFEVQRVDLRAGEQRSADYLSVNPKGRVPALLTDKGILTESPAILGYVAETFPDARLADTEDRFAFGDMQAFNVFLATTIHIAFAHASRPARYADGAAAAEAMRAKVPQALSEAFGMIEAKLSDGRPFVHGDRYTVSDPYLYVFERWLSRDGLADPGDFPRIQAHRARVEARPAVQRALAAEGLG